MSQKFSSPLQLAKASWQQGRQHLKLLLGISAVVGIPSTLASTYLVDPTADSSISAYIAFAQLAMNAALIYAAIQLAKSKKVTIRQAYYQGSTLLVRLVLFSFLMLLYAIPLMLGLLMLSFGVFAPGSTLTSVESLIIGGVALLITIPGLVLLVKGMWGAFVIGEGKAGPIEALIQSHRLTKGKVRKSLARLLALAAILAVSVAIPAGLLVALAALTGIQALSALVQFLVVVTVVPYSTLYLYKMYVELK
ncbi:hypothetical protein EPO04_00555 [Patescibacteria group bacterium]|nr:MAG: hypothetical protein EPO04_00555 [Patescibacteria group bacterium]